MTFQNASFLTVFGYISTYSVHNCVKSVTKCCFIEVDANHLTDVLMHSCRFKRLMKILSVADGLVYGDRQMLLISCVFDPMDVVHFYTPSGQCHCSDFTTTTKTFPTFFATPSTGDHAIDIFRVLQILTAPLCGVMFALCAAFLGDGLSDIFRVRVTANLHLLTLENVNEIMCYYEEVFEVYANRE